jgi:hypothetical protein
MEKGERRIAMKKFEVDKLWKMSRRLRSDD